MNMNVAFVEFVDSVINSADEDVQKTWTSMKESIAKSAESAKTLTENGMKVLQYMEENCAACDNKFTSKSIAEGMFTSGRSVSGIMKKLVDGGYVTKQAGDPVVYSLVNND